MRGFHQLVLCAALAALGSSCGEGTPTPPAPGIVPARLDIIGGNDQSALAGTELPEALTVRVTDDAGNPVVGQMLSFRVIEGNGDVFAGAARSDSRGIAKERWTLGPTPGTPQTLEVRAVDGETGEPVVFASFRATALAQEPVASVTVAPASATVSVGSTQQLTATTRDAGGNVLTGRAVTWSSSNTSVATVSASGLVTAQAGGTATITATSEGKSGTASITVNGSSAVATVGVAPATATVAVGGTRQYTATLRDAQGNVLTGRTVTWSSSNTAVATVSASGLVTAQAGGTATITATSEGKSGSASITVNGSSAVATVTVEPASVSIPLGSNRQLTATPRDAQGNALSGRTVTWTSSNELVATVSGDGVVTGRLVGSATITATSEGRSGTASVTVVVPIPGGGGARPRSPAPPH
jgi:uncharacterized protein YjdB